MPGPFQSGPNTFSKCPLRPGIPDTSKSVENPGRAIEGADAGAARGKDEKGIEQVRQKLDMFSYRCNDKGAILTTGDSVNREVSKVRVRIGHI